MEIVKKACIDVASTDDTKAFSYKMIGDYYRYLAECAVEDQQNVVKNRAL